MAFGKVWLLRKLIYIIGCLMMEESGSEAVESREASPRVVRISKAERAGGVWKTEGLQGDDEGKLVRGPNRLRLAVECVLSRELPTGITLQPVLPKIRDTFDHPLQSRGHTHIIPYTQCSERQKQHTPNI